ncbi:hypothetical protein EYF80_008850 [Liparis tanakae]|uniref:Uncharacterized protein n=1 Tax=Liparis tanakae TaxID=230148 RepID=A0A4Z2ISH5_9TELE|nr:hypothetical protein EYF80_008850 [Liparis tanakae]
MEQNPVLRRVLLLSLGSGFMLKGPPGAGQCENRSERGSESVNEGTSTATPECDVQTHACRMQGEGGGATMSEVS